MPVEIHGKSYRTVAERINEFRESHPDHTIATEIIHMGADEVVIKASILNGDKLISTGLAHERQGSTNINKTSHVENCETSAIGRALANFGLAGTEYASADEVSNAVINQKVMEATEKLRAHVQAVLQYRDSIMAIKQGIATGELSVASEEWFTLPDDAKGILWISTRDGGCWTTKEREAMKSQEFRQAYYGEAA